MMDYVDSNLDCRPQKPQSTSGLLMTFQGFQPRTWCFLQSPSLEQVHKRTICLKNVSKISTLTFSSFLLCSTSLIYSSRTGQTNLWRKVIVCSRFPKSLPKTLLICFNIPCKNDLRVQSPDCQLLDWAQDKSSYGSSGLHLKLYPFLES